MIFSNSYSDGESSMFIDQFLPRLKDELHYDYVHSYGNNIQAGTKFEKFRTIMTQTRIDNTRSLFDDIEGEDLSILIGRTNIEHMCYAQRIVYEVPAYGGDNQTNYGFCYQNARGVLTTDNGRTVLHACSDNCPDVDAN